MKELIEKLKYYNDWRRGAEVPMPEPADIGQNIEKVIVILEGLGELIKHCKSQRVTINEMRDYSIGLRCHIAAASYGEQLRLIDGVIEKLQELTK